MINFGTGLLSLIPSGVANPTPVQIGILKSVDVGIDMTLKELYGSSVFPVDVANGTGKISLKAQGADIQGGIFAAVLGGSVVTGGATGVSSSATEVSGVIPATPFTITVTPPSSGTYAEDMGVIDATAGIPMTRVASGPTTGQYSISATTYQFAAADTAHTVIIRYRYTMTVAGSKTVTYANQPMGTGTSFIVDLFDNYTVAGVSKNIGIRFLAAKFTKLSLPFKSEDYTLFDIEGAAFADASGNILAAYTGN